MAQSLAVVGQPVVDFGSNVWCDELAVIDDERSVEHVKGDVIAERIAGADALKFVGHSMFNLCGGSGLCHDFTSVRGVSGSLAHLTDLTWTGWFPEQSRGVFALDGYARSMCSD